MWARRATKPHPDAARKPREAGFAWQRRSRPSLPFALQSKTSIQDAYNQKVILLWALKRQAFCHDGTCSRHEPYQVDDRIYFWLDYLGYHGYIRRIIPIGKP